MANNYTQFSEYIPDLTPEACAWVEKVLQDPEEQSDPDKARAELKKLLSLNGNNADIIIDNWPNFTWEVRNGVTGPSVDKGLRLYCEENYNIDQLILFVQELIRRFMPDYIFTLTAAETCSEPRVGEFGGSWLAISKDEYISGNTWSAVKVHAEALRTGNSCPEIDDDDDELISLRKKGSAHTTIVSTAVSSDSIDVDDFEPKEVRVRPIEMFCCYDDKTWKDSKFVEIPEDTPERLIGEIAKKKAIERFDADDLVFTGVCQVPADWSDWPQKGNKEDKD